MTDHVTDWDHWNAVMLKCKRRSYTGLWISLIAFALAVYNAFHIFFQMPACS